MRFTSILKKLLGVTQLYVRGIAIDRDDEIAVEVTPAWRKPRCARCGTRAAQYDHPPVGWEVAGSQLGTDQDLLGVSLPAGHVCPVRWEAPQCTGALGRCGHEIHPPHGGAGRIPGQTDGHHVGNKYSRHGMNSPSASVIAT